MDNPTTASALRASGSKAGLGSQTVPPQLYIAMFLVALLMIAPRSRIVFGGPIYFIDVVAFGLLLLPLRGKLYEWVPRLPITKLVVFYVFTIMLSEFRGMLSYGTPLESFYMMARYGIAASVFYIIPRLATSKRNMALLLMALVVGAAVSSAFVILYSLGPTRPIVVSLFYSNSVMNPGWRGLIEAIAIYGADESAMRGRSLVGAATMTAGFLSIVWPLSFITYRYFQGSFIWQRISLLAIVIIPIGILMTYGRGAWVMVGVVIILVAVFGMASGRKILFAAILSGVIAYTQFEFDTEMFYFDRVLTTTQQTLDNPLDDVSTTERLYSFVEPFGHLMKNPEWLVVGAGRTGSKAGKWAEISGQLYNEGGLATHSAFALSYYAFGFPAAICQVLILILGFRFVMKRAFGTPKEQKEQKVVWQSLLMTWCTYALWWASGHAMIGEPRGAMLAFMVLGLTVAFEKLRLLEVYSAQQKASDSSS